MKKWYSESFRRNLVDMHIEDWDSQFLSQFDPDEYYANLKRANIRSAMIYLHSHVGYSYYPTKTGKMHNALIGREDLIKRLVELCRSGGIDVIGYYSLVFNTLEEDRHPEWRIIDSPDGSSERQRGSRYGHCCPNNLEYRKYIEAQIAEISEYFDLDGMFYDMTYWHGCCRCPSCMERYRIEEGEDIPDRVDFNDPAWKRFVKKRYEWIGEFAHYVTNISKKYMPNTSVEHNYAYGVAGDWNQAVTERTNDACDYCGGDPGRDKFEQSFVLKYFRSVSKNPPFEYMIYRCIPNLQQHTVTKPRDQLELEVFMTAAHHGASFIIDAMDPVGTLNPRVYELIGDVFQKLMPYEVYLSEGEPIADVGIYYSSSGRYNTKGENYNSFSCSASLCRTLVMNNIMSNVVTNADIVVDSRYKMLFAPAIAGLEDKDRQKICDYVKNGGILYFSGTEEEELLERLTGITIKGYTHTDKTYYAPTKEYQDVFGDDFDRKYPLPADCILPFTYTARKCEVMSHLTLPYFDENDKSRFSSIHSNPPAEPTEYPEMVLCEYGKGIVIWSAAPIENDKRIVYTNIFKRMIRRFLPEKAQAIVSNAPKQVELCAYKSDSGYQLCCVNLGVDEELIPIREFNVGIRMDADEALRITAVKEAASERKLDFNYENGYLKFTVSDLTAFKMLLIL